MITRKNSMIVAAAVLGAVVLSGCRRPELVSPTAANKLADRFYGALTHGDVTSAMRAFAPDFDATNWPRLLTNLQARYGRVTSANVRAFSLAAAGGQPCYLMTFQVQRERLASSERLFVCATKDRAVWFIRGHDLTRLDTNQSIAAGVLPSETGVRVP